MIQMRSWNRSGADDVRHCVFALGIAIAVGGFSDLAHAQSPIYPKRIELTTPTGPFVPPLPLQVYIEYAFRRIDVRGASVPSRADQHGAATGGDFMWTPNLFSGLRFDYRRGDDQGVIADGTGVRSITDAWGVSGYVAGYVAPPFLGGGVSVGLERVVGKTRVADGRDRADRGWRYFVSPYVALAYPVGPVQFGATPTLTLQFEDLSFRRDEANNRSNTDIDASIRFFAEWQVTQRLALTGAVTPTWVLATPNGTNLPSRDPFSVTFEGGARLWLSDHVALRVRYDYRAFDRSFRSHGVAASLSFSFVPRLPPLIPARDPTRRIPN